MACSDLKPGEKVDWFKVSAKLNGATAAIIPVEVAYLTPKMVAIKVNVMGGGQVIRCVPPEHLQRSKRAQKPE